MGRKPLFEEVVTTEFSLTCGTCNTSHTLAGDAAVVAAEIATFVAAHHEHNGFRIQAESAHREPEAAE